MEISQNCKASASWLRIIANAIVFLLVALNIFVGCSISDSSDRNPFGHTYIVDEVLYAKDLSGKNVDHILIQIYSIGTLLVCNDVQTYDYSMFGKFEAVKQENKSNSVGDEWAFFVDEEKHEQYKLLVTDEGNILFSYLENKEVQWEYKLRRIDMINCVVSTVGTLTQIQPDWFFPETFTSSSDNLIYLSSADIPGKGTLNLSVQDESITSITVYEEYYIDGNVEYSEYILKDNFNLSLSTRYESGEQYAIYRIPYGNLECWFYLKYN